VRARRRGDRREHALANHDQVHSVFALRFALSVFFATGFF